jgi:hypothetical protein
MADYFFPTVIQQTIPEADMTPLERLLLTNIFDADVYDGGIYFHAGEGPADMITLDRGALEGALAASGEAGDSRAATLVAEQLAQLEADEVEVDLDLSGSTSWECFVQDIVRRSSRLRHVTAVSSFTCSRMRPDGFGGMAVLITAERILGRSTDDLIAELFGEAGLED